MSFSTDIKLEIAANRVPRGRPAIAQAYGLFLFSHRFSCGEISLHTELQEVAELYERHTKGLLGRRCQVVVKTGRTRGRDRLSVWLPVAEERARLLELLSTSPEGGIDLGMLKEPGCIGPFLSGAYLACGNATDPHKGYHLEFVADDEILCRDLLSLLEEAIPGAKQTVRRGRHVVYYKECAQIEDLLTLMGASKGSLTMIEVEMIKDVRNKANRVTNCETANIDKLVLAAAAQIEDIGLIYRERGEESLPENLRQAARLRLDNPDLSLRELSELSGGISRSGMHHRLAALSRIANEIREKGGAS